MKIRIVLAIFLFLFFRSAYSLDVMEILNRSDAVMHPVNLQSSFTMTLISKKGDIRVIKATAYQKKKSENREDRLFLFTFPPSIKGTGLLVHSYLDMDEDRMWIYLPAVGKIKRVNLNVSGGGYFMGSDFTYNDLISRNREEYNYVLHGEAKVDGKDTYVIDVQGKTKNIQRRDGYSREVHSIRKSDFVQLKIIFYDLAGDLLKELTVKEVQQIGVYRYPSHVRMENKHTGHASEIVFENVESPDDISDEYFTHRYLQNQ